MHFSEWVHFDLFNWNKWFSDKRWWLQVGAQLSWYHQNKKNVEFQVWRKFYIWI